MVVNLMIFENISFHTFQRNGGDVMQSSMLSVTVGGEKVGKVRMGIYKLIAFFNINH